LGDEIVLHFLLETVDSEALVRNSEEARARRAIAVLTLASKEKEKPLVGRPFQGELPDFLPGLKAR
jgi:hypothetical protein